MGFLYSHSICKNHPENKFLFSLIKIHKSIDKYQGVLFCNTVILKIVSGLNILTYPP
jgi:hypothetical protein